MKITINHPLLRTLVLAVMLATQGGCDKTGSTQPRADAVPSAERQLAPGASRIVLAPLGGETRLDQQIAEAQARVRTTTNSLTALEKLGWLFIAKARVSFDSGFYKLAEQCGVAMDPLRPRAPEALLLRGYALQNLHHFNEAELLARELVARRGRAFDYGLLGDVLMEQGKLDDAANAYQRMADIKPDQHACTRAAHMRWLKGDLEGALEVMQTAVRAASPRDAEAAAWVCTRMALYQLQAGNLDQSRKHCDAALEFQPDYAPALFGRARLLLAQQKYSEAVEPLLLAVKLNPLPEYQWALADALRAANRLAEAESVERELNSRGATEDPRSYALYLATRGNNPATALRLAKAELQTRSDVFTHDVLARALGAIGRWSEAEKEVQLALREGTRDARLFLHAGMIAQHLSKAQAAEVYFTSAAALQQLLLPSERAELPDALIKRRPAGAFTAKDAQALRESIATTE